MMTCALAEARTCSHRSLGEASRVVRKSFAVAVSLFAVGWTLQFIGHAFEQKMPEFFHDWRFLFVGLRWWVAKIRGRV